MEYFTFKQNRSERAKQAEILVPALRDKKIRFKLLSKFDLDKTESDNAQVFHFVWILRDAFYSERKEIMKTGDWNLFIARWVKILNLENWAHDQKWWADHIGKDKKYNIVHPCHRKIGWTEINLSKKTNNLECKQSLIQKRKIMNTECDCFIQTSNRLVIIECKDKTGFLKEQQERHDSLIKALSILLPRKKDPIYLEISNELRKDSKGWTWNEIENNIKSAT